MDSNGSLVFSNFFPVCSTSDCSYLSSLPSEPPHRCYTSGFVFNSVAFRLHQTQNNESSKLLFFLFEQFSLLCSFYFNSWILFRM